MITYRVALPGETAFDEVTGRGSMGKAIKTAIKANILIGRPYRVYRIDEEGKSSQVWPPGGYYEKK